MARCLAIIIIHLGSIHMSRISILFMTECISKMKVGNHYREMLEKVTLVSLPKMLGVRPALKAMTDICKQLESLTRDIQKLLAFHQMFLDHAIDPSTLRLPIGISYLNHSNRDSQQQACPRPCRSASWTVHRHFHVSSTRPLTS